MDFFEKLGKKASETFNSAAEKTNKIAGETKLKLKINDCKSKINDLYKEIGKTVYQKFVVDGAFDVKDDIAEQLEKISAFTDEIEGYEAQILQLSDKKQCVKCKNKIEKAAKFCPECGTEQPEEVVQEAEVLEPEENEETEAEEVAESVEEDTTETVEESNNEE